MTLQVLNFPTSIISYAFLDRGGGIGGPGGAIAQPTFDSSPSKHFWSDPFTTAPPIGHTPPPLLDKMSRS